MWDLISNRHESDLGGRLVRFEDSNRIRVIVRVDEKNAHLAAVQHTTWMVLNILLRLKGVVDEVCLVCPEAVRLAGPVVPFARSESKLGEALLEGAGQLPFVRFQRRGESPGLVLNIGPKADPRAQINAFGEAWSGGIFSEGEIPHDLKSSLPFGPYIAACIAAAEIFKMARMRITEYSPTHRAFYSTWNCRAGTNFEPEGPADCQVALKLPTVLAGVGAVGSALMHCLWTMDVEGDLRVADNDSKGIDATNLNRYVLFGAQSVDKAKASEAARLFVNHKLRIVPHDGSFEFFFAAPNQRPTVLLSAVDNNTARAAVQDQYLPLVLSASTFDLRAELLRCGPPGNGACLRCFNPPERIASDDEIREQLAERHSELDNIASELGESRDALEKWIAEGGCGQTGIRILTALRRRLDEPATFAVGFVSVAAGTMLAAQLTKEMLRVGVGWPLNSALNRSVLQFWTPLAHVNQASFYGRDEVCPKCPPSGMATAIWSRRYREYEAKF